MTDSVLVTVAIPVGPYAVYKKWLAECLASVQAQTLPPSEVLLIDDMANVMLGDLGEFADELYWGSVRPEFGVLLKHGKPLGRIWRAPWRLGDLGAFNCGVGLADNDLVFLLSCDDMIRPDCLELCVAEWEKNQRKDAYYYVGAHYIGNEWPDQTVPFGNAMVTKGLWRLTGGLPIEAASGAGDQAHISIIMVNFPDRLIPVEGGKPLYDYRVHNETVTSRLGAWCGAVEETRKVILSTWKPPEWGRMA
jgi:hypothetical protein